MLLCMFSFTDCPTIGVSNTGPHAARSVYEYECVRFFCRRQNLAHHSFAVKLSPSAPPSRNSGCCLSMRFLALAAYFPSITLIERLHTATECVPLQRSFLAFFHRASHIPNKNLQGRADTLPRKKKINAKENLDGEDGYSRHGQLQLCRVGLSHQSFLLLRQLGDLCA